MSETETVEKKEAEMIEEEEEQQEESELDLENNPIIQAVKAQSIDNALEYTNMMIDQNELWEKHIKKHVIRIIAEKMKATNTIADKDIASTVVEGLRGRISKKYVYLCLDTSFKSKTRSDASRMAAEKRNSQTSEFKTDEQLNEEHIAATDNNSIHQLGAEQIAELDGGSVVTPAQYEAQEERSIIDQSGGALIQMKLTEYEDLHKKLEMAEKQIKAMKGELPYDQCQEVVRVFKWDKYKVGEIDQAWKSANSEVVFKIDIRTNKLLKAETDKEQNQKKRKSNKKK